MSTALTVELKLDSCNYLVLFVMTDVEIFFFSNNSSLFKMFCIANASLHIMPATSCFRTCTLPWSALRTCSPGPTLGRMAPVLRSIPRQASSTPMLCCPGHCCSPSALPTSSKTSCASKTQCQMFAVKFTSTATFLNFILLQPRAKNECMYLKMFECMCLALQAPA